MRELVTRVRNFRAERGASPTEPVLLSIAPDSQSAALLPDLQVLAPHLTHLARLSGLRFGQPSPGASQDVVAGLALGLSLARPSGEAGAARLAKTIAEIDEERAGLRSKLENPSFVEKAPAPVVLKARQRLVELEERRAALSGGAE
jgi:valyl-tRNA synthetase